VSPAPTSGSPVGVSEEAADSSLLSSRALLHPTRDVRDSAGTGPKGGPPW
jgi:hypothetical protein